MLDSNIKLVDFHCHFDLLPGFGEAGVELPCDIAIVAVTTTPLAWPRNLDVSKKKPNVIPALGIHPQLVPSRAKDFDEFHRYLNQTAIIGEIGLDGSKNFADSMLEQERIFDAVLAMCSSDTKRMLSIHSLKAESKVINHLEHHSNGSKFIPVMHWFTGSLSQAGKLCDMGAKFSFNHKMLKTKRGEKLLEYLPRESVLIETDLPFTHKSYSPKLHSELLENSLHSIAGIWNVDITESSSTVLKNSRNLLAHFSLPSSIS